MAKVIPRGLLKEIIQGADDWIKAYLAFHYVSASRMGELLEYKNSNGRITSGLRKSKIDIREDAIEWEQPNFKAQKKPTKKAYVLRNERWLYDIIKDWLKLCDEKIFPYKISWTKYKVNRYLKQFGYTSHDLRHSRGTHLSELARYSAFDINRLLGHSRLETSLAYVHPVEMKEKLIKALDDEKELEKKKEFKTDQLI